ncbi:MAG: Gfo/Idh/MocA family protein [Minwuia sp.]|uniref:Gfo/Idh/MocA family protein n=1 Tax=Minwuia sp. TaxID=2493630 RepID=UPI003A8A1CD9
MPAATEDLKGRPIRFAVIGCGRIAGKHFEAIAAHAGNAELVGVCDVDGASRKAASDKTGAPAFETMDKLISEASPDIVVLATPSGLHPQQTIRAAQAGCHVMTEKPMATRWADGRRMVDACDEAGVRLFVVKQNRRNATLQLLKRAVAGGRFGRIYSVAINVFWTRPQDYYDSADWRGTWEFDGGALMNQASHYIDLLDWLIGPIESIQAQTATLARNIQVEDTGAMLVRWRSGAIGTVNVSMLTYPENLEGSITILGEKGTVRVGGVAVNEIQHWKFAEEDPMDREVEEASYATTSVYGFGHPLYYENVIQVLRGEAVADTDGREGLKSLEVLIATYLSARDGQRISLPLEY